MNALSVTWLCDWKEHFIWRFAIFWCYWHYTITFPVIYHIVEYQDKFASLCIYHIMENIETDRANCFTPNAAPCYLGTLSSFSVQRSLLKLLSTKRISPQLLWNWDFPLSYRIALQKEERGLSAFCSRSTEWAENDNTAEGIPPSVES